MSFQQQLFPPEWCYSPALVNDRFNAAQAKYGRDAVLTDSRFQKAREMWITGTYLLGREVRTGAFFWAAPEYHDPPDTYGVGVATRESRSGLYRVNFRFEVTEWHAWDPLGLVDASMKKLAGKRYEWHTTLLVYLSRGHTRINLDGAHEELKGRAVPTEEIGLLRSTRTMGLDVQQAVVQIYPVKGATRLFRLREALNFSGGRQPALPRFRRGTKGRIEKSGPVELPLP